jgi:hypothetical protein
MSYARIYRSVLTHRKTLKLARLLSLDKFSIVGRLIALWTWCMDNASANGSLADIEPDILADVCAWDGKPSNSSTLCFQPASSKSTTQATGASMIGMRMAARSSNAKRPTPLACVKPAGNPAPALQQRPSGRVRYTCAAQVQHVRKLCRAREEERREDTESRESVAPVSDHATVVPSDPVASADASRALRLTLLLIRHERHQHPRHGHETPSGTPAPPPWAACPAIASNPASGPRASSPPSGRPKKWPLASQ